MRMLAVLTSLVLAPTIAAFQSSPDGPSTVGSVEQLGIGTGGSGGAVRLALEGAPLDTHPLQLRVRGGAPGALGSVIASLSQAPVYWPRFGTTLYFGPKVASESFIVQLDGTSPPLFQAGTLTSSMCGISFVAQGAVLDPAAQGGAAITQALDVTVGRKVHGPNFPASFVQRPVNGSDQLAVFDATGDSIIDLVTLDRDTSEVVVFPGDGSGRYGSLIGTSTGIQISAFAHGDLNQDGNVDLVVARFNDDLISVLPGTGSGTFGAPIDIQTVVQPVAVAVADLDGTPGLEIIALSRPQDEVVIVRGEGNAPLFYTAGTRPLALKTGDLNGNGIVDIVTANAWSDDVSVFLGNGDATFQSAQNYAVGDFPSYLTIGDADDDGDADLIVSSTSSDNVHLLRGVGDGTFDPKLRIANNFDPMASTIVDLDQDGFSDIAVAAPNDDEIVQLYGDASGQFSRGQPLTSERPYEVFIHDADGDGLVDLLVVSQNTLEYHPALPGGGFVEAKNVSVPNNVNQILAADFDGDQITDVAMRVYIPGYVEIRFGNGSGGFRPTTKTITLASNVVGMAAADLDGNGTTDLVIGESAGTVERRLGVGDGTFSAPLTIASSSVASEFQAGDLNGDGILDLAFFAELNQIGTLIGVGDGSFEPLATVPSVTFPNDLVLGDIDDDDDLDILVSDGDNTVVIYAATGDGTYDGGTPLSIGSARGTITEIAIADRDGDGLTDLLVVLNGTNFGELSFWPGLPNGTLGAEQLRSIGWLGESVAVGDVDGDLLLDVVTGGAGIYVFAGQPDGSLAVTPSSYGSTVRDHLLVDLNGDELPDVFLVRQGSGLILENRLMR